MIGKNLLTVLIVVVVLAVAFFGYQHFKTSRDLEAHYKSENTGLIAAAQKSPRAGMAQMGRAINKYYIENKSYPTSLDALYPKYINSKSFISDVNWNYRPAGDNFQLIKNIALEGRTLVASTDKSLSVRMGTSTTVAMIDNRTTAEPVAAKPSQMPIPETGTTPKDIANLQPTAEVPVAQMEKAKETEDMLPLKTESRDVVIDEMETPSGYVSELSNAYLVWKDEQDQLGFGNVQYPRVEGLSIATPYNWFNVKSRFHDEALSKQETMIFKSDMDMEAVASKFSEQYLVWKDKQGYLGFGNVQYPQIEGLYVATPFDWFSIKDRPQDEALDKQETMMLKSDMDMETVASKFSGQYLVWKDKNGNIGFGDTEYPATEDIEYANINGEWLRFNR